MRKAQKQDIMNMLETLEEAHQEIKDHLIKKNYDKVRVSLAQCQEFAEAIGETIERIEGQDTLSVKMLEKYCELLFHVYHEVEQDETIADYSINKRLKEQLKGIENSVKNDIHVRKEIVFFSYKASMWDSLESIYLKEKENPDSDVYCVPIPYYDKNPDGSLGQMHYERQDYPTEIQTMDWESYHLEERMPDAIYIHNPYDDWNYVTSVHPRYYASNLKKYTDELIYIPYFILPEIEPDNWQAVEKMKHFIWLPGVVYADKVILQSEKMAQIYINEYSKEAKENNFSIEHQDEELLKKKFLGLGSPKIDKVKNTRKEELTIPEDWLKIINKPDGSRKKIVFYNTSVTALLQYNEEMLKKMTDVFMTFQEKQDEVALLWRPHPLMENTIKSMRPNLWRKYESIVEQYKRDNWGIYDDSVDMDRAVILSDAYYGDLSSIVQLYQQTGKPIMIQDIYILHS